MKTEFWRNWWCGGWAIIGTLLFFFVCFGGCNPAKGETWSFTIPASLIKDGCNVS